MMKEYFEIIKEIQELQKELVSINSEMRIVKNNIEHLQHQKQELEGKMTKYESHIKTLSLIEQNKSRIDSIIIENAKNDINMLYGKRNNTSSEIFNCKVKIGQQESEYKELEAKALPIKKELKNKYFRRDLFLNAILMTEVTNTPQDETNNAKNR